MTFSRQLVLAAACLSAPCAAQGFEDLEQLDVRLAAELGAGIGEPGGAMRPIDRRLKLAACPGAAEIAPPALGAATIRCAPLGWRIRVPVVRTAAAPPPAAATPAAPAAAAAPLVRKGDRIELTVEGTAFTVSTLATAEQDGAAGQRIRVRADRAAAPVTATVTADGGALLERFK